MARHFILCIGYLLASMVYVLAQNECSKIPPELEKASKDCCQPPKLKQGNAQNKCAKIDNIFCLLECVFNETQIIQNGQVNTANLKARFDVELQPDPEYIPIAMNAVQTCYTFVTQKMKNKDEKVGGCSVLPSLVSECTDTQIFVNCPANKWKSNQLCDSAKAYLKKCPVLNFPMNN